MTPIDMGSVSGRKTNTASLASAESISSVRTLLIA